MVGWRAGDGDSIILGIDPIARLNTNFILSSELHAYLNDYGIYTLSQARNRGDMSTFSSYWFSAKDLELGGV